MEEQETEQPWYIKALDQAQSDFYDVMFEVHIMVTDKSALEKTLAEITLPRSIKRQYSLPGDLILMVASVQGPKRAADCEEVAAFARICAKNGYWIRISSSNIPDDEDLDCP